jgi:hypothetical protein
MASEWLGLNEIAGSANFTFVAFITYVLLTVIGVRFGLYAYWNGRANEVDSQVPLWGYLLLIGVTATLAGIVGVLRIVLTIFGGPLLDLAGSLMLVMVLCLALALRAVYASTTDAGAGPDDSTVVAVFVVAVAASTLGMVLLGSMRTPFAGLQGVTGALILLYGYRFGSRQLANTRVQGTLLDTLLRHLLPVLLFGSMIPLSELAVVAGLDRAVVLHVQIVFVIMTATTLMTATIKLRQTLVGMRG